MCTLRGAETPLAKARHVGPSPYKPPMQRRFDRTLQALALALCQLASSVIAAKAADDDQRNLLPPLPLNERVLKLPGDPARPAALQVTLFMPAGPGPFPLAVMNHGATSITPTSGKTAPRYRLTFSAFYFLSRGYAVALPMMRGFAGSGGSLAPYGCDAERLGLDNAKDIAAVIDDLAKEPKIDTARVVVAGQSYGGWNTLAFGTLGQPGVKGLINFVGGVHESDCANQDASLIAAAGALGAKARVPSLWFYGENDKTFAPATWRAMYTRYSSAGGKAELVDFGSFMDDAHQLLSHPEGLVLWTPKADAFLTSVGLPAKPLYPQYLPSPFPPASHYAAIDDVAAVPYLNEKGRASYEAFLRSPFTRAFIVAPNGISVTSDGGFDAIARGLTLCTQHASGCQLYAVNNDVVWRGNMVGEAAPPEQTFERTVAAGAGTALNFAYSLNPDCSSRALPKLSMVRPPTHGTVKIEERSDFPRFPPGNPFAKCNAAKVSGVSVEYTPQSGFTGSDEFAFGEVMDGQHRLIRLMLSVR